MISAITNSPAFTSVIPVRVKVDGKESYSEYFIRPACRKLSAILFGPAKQTDEKNMAIIKAFAKHDPDYKFNRGLSGHPKNKTGKKAVPSDYFRYICQNFEHYFMTGLQAETLKKYGKQVGNEKYAGKILEVDNSFDVQVAQGNYWSAIKHYIKNKSLRLTEFFDEKSGKKSGKPLALLIDMTSNGKYGASDFKMDIEKISFVTA